MALPPSYYFFPGNVTPQFPQNRLLPTWKGCGPISLSGALPSGSYEGPVGRIVYSQNVQDLMTLRGLGMKGLVFSGSQTLTGLGKATPAYSSGGAGGSSSGSSGGKPTNPMPAPSVGTKPTNSGAQSSGGSKVPGSGTITTSGKPNYDPNYSNSSGTSVDDVMHYIDMGIHTVGQALSTGFDIADRFEGRNNTPATTPNTTQPDPYQPPPQDNSQPAVAPSNSQPQSTGTSNNNLLLYVLGGVAAVSLLVLGYKSMKGK